MSTVGHPTFAMISRYSYAMFTVLEITEADVGELGRRAPFEALDTRRHEHASEALSSEYIAGLQGEPWSAAPVPSDTRLHLPLARPLRHKPGEISGRHIRKRIIKF